MHDARLSRPNASLNSLSVYFPNVKQLDLILMSCQPRCSRGPVYQLIQVPSETKMSAYFASLGVNQDHYFFRGDKLYINLYNEFQAKCFLFCLRSPFFTFDDTPSLMLCKQFKRVTPLSHLRRLSQNSTKPIKSWNPFRGRGVRLRGSKINRISTRQDCMGLMFLAYFQHINALAIPAQINFHNRLNY